MLTPVLIASKTETRCDGVAEVPADYIISLRVKLRVKLVKLLPVDMKFYVRVKLGKLPVGQRTARRYDGAPDTESAYVSIRQHTSAHVAAEAL